MVKLTVALAAALVAAAPIHAEEPLTVYRLLAPATHSFDIVFDVSAKLAGSPYFFNLEREGAKASKQRAVDLATGKPLELATVKGKEAKAGGFVSAQTADAAEFLRVTLLHPVPKNAETRIRILKTYEDAQSYHEAAGSLVFERAFSVKRNVVILPPGYELTGSVSPGIVNIDTEGCVHISFLNDRDDSLQVRITGRKRP